MIMKNVVSVTNEILLQRNRELRTRYTSPLIKWYQATMTKEEKFKLGMMTYEEFNEWQEELAQEEALKAEEEAAKAESTNEDIKDADNNETSSEESAAISTPESTNHTFWEDDTEDRDNLSNASYEEFLKSNGLDVSNKNTVNVEAIMEMDLGSDTDAAST